jgi:hypothetical protein
MSPDEARQLSGHPLPAIPAKLFATVLQSSVIGWRFAAPLGRGNASAYRST